jgi:hypothetical protein
MCQKNTIRQKTVLYKSKRKDSNRKTMNTLNMVILKHKMNCEKVNISPGRSMRAARKINTYMTTVASQNKSYYIHYLSPHLMVCNKSGGSFSMNLGRKNSLNQHYFGLEGKLSLGACFLDVLLHLSLSPRW